MDSKYVSFIAIFELNTDSRYNLPLIELCLCVKDGLQVRVCHSHLCVKKGLQVQLTTHSYPCVISSERNNGSAIIFILDGVYDYTASV